MLKVLFASAVDPLSVAETLYPPLWPAYLAAHAESRLGCGIVDFRSAAGKYEHELASFAPHLVAISSVTQNFGIATRYARLAKQRGIPVIVGGMHISSLPQSLSAEMDIGCLGEGEITFTELLELYLSRRTFDPVDLSGIRGIVFRDGPRLVRTEDRPVIPKLDSIPHPKRSIIGYGRRGYLYTARGCPDNCVFCACSRYWGAVRFASPEYVLEEVRELVAHGARRIRFSDENFVCNLDRLRRIAALITADGLHRQARFSCWCRANYVTPEVVQILRSMNVVSVKMGLESGCDRTLAYLKGNVTVADNIRAIDLLKDAGMQVNGDFLIGAPRETLEEMEQTYRFIRDSRLDLVDVNVFSPLPGTPVWDDAARRGLVSDVMDWGRLNYKFNANPATAIHLSEMLNHRELSRMHRKMQRLRVMMIARALPHSPWKQELPGVAVRMVVEKLGKMGRLLYGGGTYGV